jgi:response regulator RpfG family c-di-GMP phosphodiesterase
MTDATLLLVDDEPQLLASLSSYLKSRYTVLTATSGAQGLERLAADGPVAVIVSDMRMPGMDGASFLARARAVAPSAVRLLLTGQADVNSAIAAINDGQIFRFLTKPTPPPVFLAVIEAAVAQHRLITAEKVLLEQTLRGALRTMTEILALANPTVFGQAVRIKRMVNELGRTLGLADHWQIEVAAMLSQLAQISLPAEVADKVGHASELSADERAMVARLPMVTDQLLAHIPRLETVRVMLALCQEPQARSDCSHPEGDTDVVNAGVKLIRAAVTFDALTQGGMLTADAVGVLRGQPDRFDREVVAALAKQYAPENDGREVIKIDVRRMLPGMVLAEDLVSKAGILIITRGCEVTETFLEKIRNYRSGSLKDSVLIVNSKRNEASSAVP